MKCILTTVFWLSLQLSICQVLEEKLAYDIEQDSSHMDYQYTQSTDFDHIDYQTHLPLIPKKQLVVRYWNSATALVEFSKSLPNEVFLRSNKRSVPLRTNKNGRVILEDLAIDQLYELVVRDNGEEIKVGTISTFETASETSWIDMYSSMYNPVRDWITASAGQQDIYEFVNNQENWHTLEKTWFLQQYIGYGYALPDKLLGRVPREGDFGRVDLRSDCMCRPLRLTFQHDLRPRTSIIQTQQKDGEYVNVWGTPPSEDFNTAGKQWVAWGTRGPAKYMQAWQETPRCTGGDTFDNTLSFDEQDLKGAGMAYEETAGANQSSLRMIWACVDYSDMIPTNCLCERDPRVRVCYTYTGEATVATQTIGGGWCSGGRSMAAYAEDIALVAYNEDAANLSNAEIIAAGNVLAGSACNRQVVWSDQKLSMPRAVAYASQVLSRSDANTGTNALEQARVVSDINEKILANSFDNTGNCGTISSLDPSVIDGCFTRILNQNTESVVLLQSNGKVHVEGNGRHKGTAKILSSYGLTVTMQRSDPDQIGDICCRTGNGVYSLSHTPGLPFSNLASLQSWARNNFFADGIDLVEDISDMNGHYGYRDGGGINEECDLQLSNVVLNSENLVATNGSFEVKTATETLYITNGTSTELQLVIYDFSGRAVKQYTVPPNLDYTIDYSHEPWPSGLYLVRISDGNTNRSEKIYKR